MSGKRLILLMFIGIVLTSAVMYALYFLTRQLDYISPDDQPEGPPSPNAVVRTVQTAC